MASYLDPRTVQTEYVKVKNIGSGSDGAVELYKHYKTPGKCLAVKYPLDGHENQTEDIIAEIDCLQMLGKHDNIVEILGWDFDWAPHAPAMFVSFCPLGDVHGYRSELKNALGYIPEDTIWKLFLDMVKALNFLHEALSVPVVHGDLKPENILVQGPLGWVLKEGFLPTLPTFKLADFSRATPYMPGYAPEPLYQGTRAYAPPREECMQGITPATDIWSLGATLQFFAYGALPTQRLQEFVWDLKAQGLLRLGDNPTAAFFDQRVDLASLWPVVYRPLSVSAEEQVLQWGVEVRDVILRPYSNELNMWYSMLMQPDRGKRIPVAYLALWFVPLAERQLSLLYHRKNAAFSIRYAEQLREEAGRSRAGLNNAGLVPVVPLH
ncbi:kinase-like protein [Melanomma pulvis-pyrius CBS 109.77]|uniref:Kinase-like protein n=1 Tax=Melanomma pulvis-pyrius CBS 109.77 TaxID=1314802 RepID=A0A6A6WTQ3_9PLEO|nr:kinase-like protein [Melanomma pulvis-pyrius CBS 109.77]